MPSGRRQILAALILISAPVPAWSETPALVTLRGFWNLCSERHVSPEKQAWCYGYVLGHIDATGTIGAALRRAPLCITADNRTLAVERVITFMPTDRNEDGAGAYVQAAIVRAFRCD